MEASDNKSNAIPALLLALGLSLGLADRPAYAESHQALSPETSIESIAIPDEFVAEQRLSAEESKRVIKEVMKTEGLNQEEKVMGWRYIDKDEEIPEDRETPEWLKSFSSVLAKILEFSLWIMVAAGIIALYVFRKYWLPLLESNANKKQIEQPEILFGMDVTSESLPDDVVASARSLWQAGKSRDALSLLYRSALTLLITQEQLELKHSHTEGDIQRLSQKHLNATRQQYFQQLTKQWVQIAYAHLPPDEAEMDYLLDHWEPEFAIQTPGLAK